MRRFAWVLFAAAALSGCPEKKPAVEDAGTAPQGPAQVDEAEPNNSADKAQALSASSIVVASLGADPKTPDEDWYALVAQGGPRQVDVNVSGIAGADVQLGVFDQDGNPIITVNSNGDGKGERFPNLNVTQKLLLKVSGAKKGSGGAYTLTATFKDVTPGFEAEPNDRAVDATPLPLDAPMQGFLAHAADEDWYRIELPATEGTPPPAPAPQQPAPQGAPPEPGTGAVNPTAPTETGGPDMVPPSTEAAAPAPDAGAAPPAAADAAVVQAPEAPSTALRIEVTPVKGAKLEVSLLSAAEAPLFNVKGGDDQGLTLRNIGVRANDRVVYLVVKSAWSGTGKDARRGYNPEEPYTVSVAIEAAGANAEFEPNDELPKATALPANGYKEGFLSPKTDVDYFVLRTDQPVLAQVQLTGVDRVDLQLEVVRLTADGKEESLLRANDGEIKEGEQLNDVSCPGECFFKVTGASRKVDGKWVRDFENAEMPYRLNVTTEPDVGATEREPNNTPDLATTLGMGHPVRGTIQPRRDVDYYKLDLSGRPVRTPIQATLLGILKVDLGLYLHRLEPDGKLTLVQTSDRAKGDQPERIRYSAEPGVYVFEVRDSSKRYEANFQDRYQLTVSEGE